MINFKIYTLEKVRNRLITSKNFFKGVFSTLLESVPNKPISFNEFFRRVYS